jgi:FAD/FMN-containing dehydrogenase
VKAFNFLYYNKQFKALQNSIVHYETFYYPLDGILHWNRIYGKNGFTQYQFVLPPEKSREGLIAIIEKIGQRKMGSFLTVLKLFGEQKENYIRFPKGGYTLAIDFKINPEVWKFLDELDELVLKYGGRVYLTKDVRMTHEMLVNSYPQAQSFIDKIQELDPEFKFASAQSERIEMTNSKL